MKYVHNIVRTACDKIRYNTVYRIYCLPMHRVVPCDDQIPSLQTTWISLNVHCLERNMPTLASSSFDKHGVILIIFGK